MNLVEKAHCEISAFLKGRRGIFVLDATCGNGRDTLKLAQMGCRVFAFDIQVEALKRTRELLATNSVEHSVSLFKCSHADLCAALPPEAFGKIKTAMFNLGWLPLSDKQVVTTAESTLKALTELERVVDKSENIVTVLSYRAHEGGQEEFEAVSERLKSYDPKLFGDIENPRSPILFVFKI